jgi:hypothetical protein
MRPSLYNRKSDASHCEYKADRIHRNVLKTVFDHIIDKIIKLIDDQIEEAEEREHSIKVSNKNMGNGRTDSLATGYPPCWRFWREQIPS